MEWVSEEGAVRVPKLLSWNVSHGVHKSGEAIMAEEELSKERIIGKVGVEGAEHILLSL